MGNHELERLRQMDYDWEAKEEEEDFQARREAKANADDEMTEKRSSKRRKRKELKKDAKLQEKQAQGLNQFQGDGSFLEMFKSMSPEEQEAKLKETEKNSLKVAPGVK